MPFDPYELLGVGLDATDIEIQLAYKSRIRLVHPDVAGSGALEAAKRLNAARDILLNPELRAQLPRPQRARPRTGRHRPTTEPKPPGAGEERARGSREEGARRPRHRRRRASEPGREGASRKRPPRSGPYWEFEWSATFDPFAFDFGPRTEELRAFFRRILELTDDEVARVRRCSPIEGWHSGSSALGWRPFLDRLLVKSCEAVHVAVEQLWSTRAGRDGLPAKWWDSALLEGYAQWILLGNFLRAELGDARVRGWRGGEWVLTADWLQGELTRGWRAAAGHRRYCPHTDEVEQFLDRARTLSVWSAERLARSWQRRFGSRGWSARVSGGYGPLPMPWSHDPEFDDVRELSGMIAADAADLVPPPDGLASRHHEDYRAALRWTAHVLAIGGGTDRRLDEGMEPWRLAVAPSEPSFWDRMRFRVANGLR